ncbi:hypothetical protein ABW19_dt0205057 [Dactylella cylindrospora]|nr:hypothetical protein ABW19_dt0205057 [Dactylella cylindrospora]
MPPRAPQFDGLQWVQETFSLEPKWTVEPDPEAIKQAIKEKCEPSAQDIAVSFLAQGAFNKIYNVQIDGETLIMRVFLPVDPMHKTLSEVATVQWVRLHTSLPVPEILCYNSHRGDKVGFEWILMEKIPGKPLADA